MDNNENGKEEDTDQFFLDHVLNTLYDFGDGTVSKREHKSQKKRSKRSEVEDEDTAADNCSDTKDSLEVRHSDISAIDLPGASEVGNTSSTTKRAPPVEVVTFQDPTKRPRQARKPPVPEVKDKPPQTKEKNKVDPDEFSLEKARLEVHRFGITGYQKVQQRVFEQERAIMLGARPPKKEYVNYKVLQQRVKDKKQKTKEEIQTDLKKKKTTKPRDEKRKSVKSSKAPTGQVGRFKNGMLVLSTKEIQKIKASIKKK
ncbi:40S small subunit processome assembly factor 1 [Salmo trutta]|uniref:Zgc:194224 n=1 Tax=Salmo trutta TaxID=8032 RepID=A0A674EGP4_SALTR|nr:uncharacterized protein C1orf131 homolog [Salmo trutta]